MSKVCPSCGHCPECGRGGVQVQPHYFPYWPYYTPYQWYGGAGSGVYTTTGGAGQATTGTNPQNVTGISPDRDSYLTSLTQTLRKDGGESTP